MTKRFIVAEVSKNWGSNAVGADLLSERFEVVIQTNLERGYSLKDWKFNVTVIPDHGINETIIAIFERIAE